MTRLTGAEPKHWHDAGGQHRMTDPRILNVHERYWTTDERAYVAHLVAHEADVSDPQPQPDDTAAVTAMFALLRSREAEVRTVKELIITMRKAARRGSAR